MYLSNFEENASLVKLIHIFERGGFLYNSFLFGNAKKNTKTTKKKKKKKERRKVTAKDLKAIF